MLKQNRMQETLFIKSTIYNCLKAIITLSVSTFVLAGCGQSEVPTSEEDLKNTAKEETVVAVQMEPKYDQPVFHRVIFLDSLYTQCLNATSRDYANRNQLYIKMIAEPIFKLFEKAEYIDFIKGDFSHPIQDTAKLRRKIAALGEDKVKIRKKIAEAFTKSNRYLRNDSMTFYVLPGSTNRDDILQRMGGVSGSTVGDKESIFTIDPTMQTWDQVVEYAVAHEFSHAYWTKNHFDKNYKLRVLDYLIFEGKADAFAHALYPTAKAPWATALNSVQCSDLWVQVKPNLNNEDQAFIAALMYGSLSLPQWGGYSMGFDMMRTAFKNDPDLIKQEWTDMPPADLLKLSDYK